jgi:WD40 repeat protein
LLTAISKVSGGIKIGGRLYSMPPTVFLRNTERINIFVISKLMIQKLISSIHPFSLKILTFSIYYTLKFVVLENKGLVTLPAATDQIQFVDLIRGRTVALIHAALKSKATCVSKNDCCESLTNMNFSKCKECHNPFGITSRGKENILLVTSFKTSFKCRESLTQTKSFTSDLFSLTFWEKEYNTELNLRFNPVITINGAHKDKITSASFSPINSIATLCVSTSIDGTFKIWQRAKKKMLIGDQAHAKNLNCVYSYATWKLSFIGSYLMEKLLSCCFSSDGSLLVIGSSIGKISVWDPLKNVLLSVTNYHTPSCILYLKSNYYNSSSIREVLIGNAGGELFLFDIDRSTVFWVLNIETSSSIRIQNISNTSGTFLVAITKYGRSRKSFVLYLDLTTVTSMVDLCYFLVEESDCIGVYPSFADDSETFFVINDLREVLTYETSHYSCAKKVPKKYKENQRQNERRISNNESNNFNTKISRNPIQNTKATLTFLSSLESGVKHNIATLSHEFLKNLNL